MKKVMRSQPIRRGRALIFPRVVEVVSARRLDDTSVSRDPFAQTEAQSPRDEGLGAPPGEVIKIRSRLASDFNDIFKPGGRDQCSARAFAFQQSVGSHSRSVDDLD